MMSEVSAGKIQTLCAKLFQSWLKQQSLRPCGLLCPWDSPGKNTRMGCCFLLQGIFLTQGLNPRLLCLLHWEPGSLPLGPPGKPPGKPLRLRGSQWLGLESFEDLFNHTSGDWVGMTQRLRLPTQVHIWGFSTWLGTSQHSSLREVSFRHNHSSQPREACIAASSYSVLPSHWLKHSQDYSESREETRDPISWEESQGHIIKQNQTDRDGKYCCSHFGKYKLQSLNSLPNAIFESVLGYNGLHSLWLCSVCDQMLWINQVCAKVQPASNNSNKRHHLLTCTLNTCNVPGKHDLIPFSEWQKELITTPILWTRKLDHKGVK